jgi:hypothetical protein
MTKSLRVQMAQCDIEMLYIFLYKAGEMLCPIASGTY